MQPTHVPTHYSVPQVTTDNVMVVVEAPDGFVLTMPTQNVPLRPASSQAQRVSRVRGRGPLDAPVRLPTQAEDRVARSAAAAFARRRDEDAYDAAHGIVPRAGPAARHRMILSPRVGWYDGFSPSDWRFVPLFADLAETLAACERGEADWTDAGSFGPRTLLAVAAERSPGFVAFDTRSPNAEEHEYLFRGGDGARATLAIGTGALRDVTGPLDPCLLRFVIPPGVLGDADEPVAEYEVDIDCDGELCRVDVSVMRDARGWRPNYVATCVYPGDWVRVDPCTFMRGEEPGEVAALLRVLGDVTDYLHARSILATSRSA